MKRAHRKVVLEGKTFKSFAAAGRYIQADPSSLRWAAKHNGIYKGLSIQYADELNKEITKTKSKKVHYNGVKVASEHKVFNSISDAAKYLKQNRYILRNRLRINGSYTDENGEVYKAIDPAKARKYPEGVKRAESVHIQPEKTIPQTKQLSGIEIARNLLKDKVNSCIQTNNYKMAKELIDVIEQIKE